MFEELYEKIPDLYAYLDRLELYPPVQPDLDSLCELIWRHQCLIPYENLDIWCHASMHDANTPVSLSIPDLFNKIIERERGGYCFELNGLFFQFLKDLGFQVTPALCKVIEGPGPNYPAFHRATIAWLDGDPYYCDVGFGGPMPAGAMKIENNTIQTFAGYNYSFFRRNYNWWELVRFDHSGKRIPMVYVNTEPYDQADFHTLSNYVSSFPPTDMDHFTGNLLLNIRTPDGYAAITNHTFTQRKGTETITRTDLTESAVSELIRGLFRVRGLPEGIIFYPSEI